MQGKRLGKKVVCFSNLFLIPSLTVFLQIRDCPAPSSVPFSPLGASDLYVPWDAVLSYRSALEIELKLLSVPYNLVKGTNSGMPVIFWGNPLAYA